MLVRCQAVAGWYCSSGREDNMAVLELDSTRGGDGGPRLAMGPVTMGVEERTIEEGGAAHGG